MVLLDRWMCVVIRREILLTPTDLLPTTRRSARAVEQAGFQGSAGCYSGVLPVVCDLNGCESVAALARAMRTASLAALEHPSVPLMDLVQVRNQRDQICV